MQRYEFIVIETRQTECRYVVEASDADTARAMAERGDTYSEDPYRDLGVTDRQVIG